MATERYDAIINVDYTGQSGVARYLADVRRIMQASQDLFGAAGGASPLALPAGTGQPRVDNRFVSRQRATEVAQDQFIRALRERVDAERIAAQAARRSAALERITGRPGAAGLDFAPGGGVIGVKFNENLRQLETGSQRLARQVDQLTRNLARAEANLKPVTARERNAYAADYNRGVIEALSGRYSSDLGGQSMEGSTLVRSSYKVAQELEELVQVLRGSPNQNEAIRKLLYEGVATSTLLRRLAPETREVLTGSPEGPRALGVTTRYGIPVEGLIDQQRAQRLLESERVGGFDDQLRSAKIAHAQALQEEAQAIAVGSQSTAQLAAAERRAEAARLRQAINADLFAAAERAAATRLETFYHTSPEKNFQSIMQRGLLPGAAGPDVFLSKNPGAFGTAGNIYEVLLDPRKLNQGVGADRDFYQSHGYYKHPGAIGRDAIREVVGNYPRWSEPGVPDDWKQLYQAGTGFSRLGMGKMYPGLFPGGPTTFGDTPPPLAIESGDKYRERVAALDQLAASARKAAKAEDDAAVAAERLARQAAGAAPPGGGIGGGGGRTGFGGPDEPGGGDDGFRSLQEEFDRRIREQGASGFDEVHRAQTRLAKAENNLANVIDKMSLDFGTKGAFKDEDAAFSAYAGAKAARDAADQAYTNAQRRRAKTAEDAARAEQDQANQPPEFGPVDRLQIHRRMFERGEISEVRRAELDKQVVAEQLAAARKNLAVASRSTSTHQAYVAALEQLTIMETYHTKAAKALADAEARAAAATVQPGGPAGPGGGGPPGTFLGDFGHGFRGRGDRSYAEQLGQTFKFSVFYGTAYKLLFGLTQTLQATLQEGIAFQDAMTDLSIATGRPKEELDNLANALGRASTEAGFAPSQAIQIGARAVGLYGATAAPPADQARVAAISADVVTKLARVAPGKQPVELQGDIAAIVQALGYGAEGQFRVADLDAYLTKRFGAPAGSTFEALAQSGSVGKAAGFTDEQLFSLASLMISRTGQTPTAVGGYLAQIFSRGGEGSLTNVAQRYGVDTSQSLAKQFGDLSRVYGQGDEATQTAISAAFGRGKVQNAVVAALQDYSEVLDAASDAQQDATGTLDDLFGERMRNIGGQLAQLGGVMKETAGLLGESGLLDVVGLLAIGFREFLETLNGVLRLWNELPSVIQDTILAMAALSLASKAGAGSAILGGIGGPGRLGTGLAYGPAVAGTGSAVYTQRVATTASGAVVPLATRTGLAAAGRAALAAVGPFGLAIGGLLAIGSLKNSVDRMRDASNQAADQLLNSDLTFGSGAADYNAQAAALEANAKQVQEAPGFFMNLITGWQASRNANSEADRLRDQAGFLEEVAKIQEAQAAAKVDATPAIFKDFSESGLSTALESLTAGGASAQRQLDLLRDAIAGVGSSSEKTRGDLTKFKPSEFAAQAAEPIYGNIADLFAGEGAHTTPDGREIIDSKSLRNMLAKKFGGAEEIRDRLLSELQGRGISTGEALDPAVIEEIAGTIAPNLAQTLLGPYASYFDDGGATIARVQANIDSAIANELGRIVDTQFGGALGTRTRTPDETLGAMRTQADLSQQVRDSLPQTDYKGRVDEARKNLTVVQQLRKQGQVDDNTRDSVNDIISQARSDLAAAQIDELENLRKVALRNAKTRRQAIAASRGFIRQQIDAAIDAGDPDLLANIISSAGKGAASIARKAIESAIAAARSAQAVLAELGRITGALMGPAGAILGIAGAAMEAGTIASLQGLADVVDTTASGTTDEEISGWGGGGGDSGASKATAAQIAAARAQAYATRDGGAIASAKAAMQSARADMDAAKKGTVEYYNALGAFFSAQQQLTEAIRAHQKNVGLLRIDATNPLQVAQLEARLARQKLQQDIAAGRGADVIAQDKVDLRAAQANAEATRFSQRLQAVQTAEELGRISHKKYINYLENEKRRLEAIKNRTYQQQDQLNQVDRLLKDAASQMEGQFNFGDIKLPTPYQVRRYVESNLPITSTTQARSNSSPTTTTLNLYVNGADTAKVTRIVQDVVAKGARVNTTATRRR